MYLEKKDLHGIGDFLLNILPGRGHLITYVDLRVSQWKYSKPRDRVPSKGEILYERWLALDEHADEDEMTRLRRFRRVLIAEIITNLPNVEHVDILGVAVPAFGPGVAAHLRELEVADAHCLHSASRRVTTSLRIDMKGEGAKTTSRGDLASFLSAFPHITFLQ